MKIIIILILTLLIFALSTMMYCYKYTESENFESITDKIDKIYYINLDRRPDRNEHFIKQANKLNLNVIRFKAIDGLEYEFSDEEINMFKKSDFINTEAEKKIMGNQLSHFYILNEMIKNNYEYILIFQDDVILRDDFNEQINNLMNNIPDDAEIINFGFHKTANMKNFEALDLNDPEESKVQSKKDINDAVCILSDNVNPCSLSYLVTLKGAINLVNYFNDVGFLKATDWNYNDYLVSKNINYATKIVLCTGNPNFGSDIFN